MPSIATETDTPAPQVNGITAHNAHVNGIPTTQSSAPTNVPPEVEHTLSRLSTHRNVRGVLILARQGSIIRYTGAAFEGEQGRKYAAVVKKIVDCCHAGLEDVGEEGDELKFMRMRTKKHELMISPDERYILVVLQDPSQ